MSEKEIQERFVAHRELVKEAMTDQMLVEQMKRLRQKSYLIELEHSLIAFGVLMSALERENDRELSLDFGVAVSKLAISLSSPQVQITMAALIKRYEKVQDGAGDR